MTEPDRPEDALTCQWCGVAASPDATRCAGCGAALARRESIGDLVIPGVTGLDPALAALDGQPLRIPRASPSQGMAGGAVMAAAMGGPVGLAALGALGAVAATEYALAGGGGEAAKARLDALGTPNELAVRMLEKLEKEEADAPPADPWRDVRMSTEHGTPATAESAPGAPPADRADEVGGGGHADEDERPAE